MPKVSTRRVRHPSRDCCYDRRKTDGESKVQRESPCRGKSRPFVAGPPSSDHSVSSKTQDHVEHSMTSTLDGIRATIETTDAHKASRQSHREISSRPSPCSSQESTILNEDSDHPNNEQDFAGIAPNTCLEDVEFEFESVVRMDGDQCLVRWTDSTIPDADLHGRYLHNLRLLEYVSHSQSIGEGFSRVSWKLTWEPLDILKDYEDDVKRECQFEYANVVGEQDGYSLVRWDNTILHISTLENMNDHPLLEWVESFSHPLALNYVDVAWKPMWVSNKIMEACEGRD